MRRSIACALLLLLTSCNRTPPPPPEAPPGNAEPQIITGKERLGWGQRAADAVELATFGYAIYVDGARSILNASCETTSSTTNYACTAPLPGMSPGPHTLELASFTNEGGSVLESSRSAPIRVSVTAATAPTAQDAAVTAPRTSHALATPSESGAEVLAQSLQAVTDVAALPDARVLVAEAGGRIVAIAPAASGAATTALALNGRVLSIAAAPQFARTHLVYVASGQQISGGEWSIDVARYREVSGTLGERVTIVNDVRGSRVPRAIVRFGPDGLLYAAFDDGGDARDAEDLASRNGKVLRLNPDGSTPRDQAGGSPVYAWPFHAPAALAWSGDAAVLWSIDAPAGTMPALRAIVGRGARGRQAPPPQATPLPQAADVLGGAFVGPDLLLAAGGRGVLRVRFDTANPMHVRDVAPVLRELVSHARAIASDGDRVYIATDSELLRVDAGRVTPP